MRAKTAAVWQKHFQRLAGPGRHTDQQRKTFATCLYRAPKFPHRIYELDEADKPIHRSPYDGKVHTGVLYADNGFWDTYRTVYAFYSVVYPAQWRRSSRAGYRPTARTIGIRNGPARATAVA